MSKRSNWKREGYMSFCPGDNPEECCPYKKESQTYNRECWIEGWKGADEEHKANEALLEIGYDWEDPEGDIIAAVRQLQDMFDEQLRGS